jgi:hypothetical protein
MKHLYQPLFARSNPEIETVTAKRGEVVKFLPPRSNPTPYLEAPEGVDQVFWGLLPNAEKDIVWLIDFTTDEAPIMMDPTLWLADTRDGRIQYYVDRGDITDALNDYFEDTDDPRLAELEEDTGDVGVGTVLAPEGSDDIPDYLRVLTDSWEYAPPLYDGGVGEWSELNDLEKQLIYFIDYAQYPEAPDGVDANYWFGLAREDKIASSAENVAESALLVEYFDNTSSGEGMDFLGAVNEFASAFFNYWFPNQITPEPIIISIVDLCASFRDAYLQNPENDLDVVENWIVSRLETGLHLFLYRAFPSYSPQQLAEAFELALEIENDEALYNYLLGGRDYASEYTTNELSPVCEVNLDGLGEIETIQSEFCALSAEFQVAAYFAETFPFVRRYAPTSTESAAVHAQVLLGLTGLTVDTVDELIKNIELDDDIVTSISQAAVPVKKPMQLGTKIGLGLTAVLLGRGIYVAYKHSQGDPVNYFGTLLDSRGPIPPTPVFPRG